VTGHHPCDEELADLAGLDIVYAMVMLPEEGHAA